MIETCSFLELSKACRKAASEDTEQAERLKIYVLADSASQQLTTAIKGCAYLEGIDAEVREADYDQIDLQISDSDSELYIFNPDYLVIYMCVQKAQELFYKESPAKEENLRRTDLQGYRVILIASRIIFQTAKLFFRFT